MMFCWSSGHIKDIPVHANFHGIIKDGQRPCQIILSRQDILEATKALTPVEIAVWFTRIQMSLK